MKLLKAHMITTMESKGQETVDARQAAEAASAQGGSQGGGSEEAVAAHNERMAAAYVHMAERAQVLPS